MAGQIEPGTGWGLDNEGGINPTGEQQGQDPGQKQQGSAQGQQGQKSRGAPGSYDPKNRDQGEEKKQAVDEIGVDPNASVDPDDMD